MDKNTIIGLVLIAGIFVGFSIYQSSQARKLAEIQAQQDSIALARMPSPVDTDTVSVNSVAADSSAVESSARNQPSVYKDSALAGAAKAEAQIVTLENSKIKVQFTTRGAQPYSVMVKNYFNYDSTELYIFKPGKAEYSLGVYTGEDIQTRNFTFNIAEQTDSSLVMRLPFNGGGYLEQKYILHKDSYNVTDQLSFVGGIIPRKVNSIDVDFDVTIPRMEKGYKNESQYSKLDYYFNGDKKPVEIGRGRSGSKRVDSKLSWFAFQQQFFSAIVRAPQQFSSGDLAVNFLPQDDPDRNLMTCSAKMRTEITPEQNITIPFEFYFGPNNFKLLKSYDQKYEKIIPLGGSLVGWFTKFVIIPLFDFFRRYTANFGLIILLMTIVIKIVVFPLTYKSYASSAKMTALKPEMDKINAKFTHADDQQEQMKKQQANMDLYKRAGVSPMGGCLPTLLTFHILWAMFRFFPASIELRQQPFLWCHDLSAYDSILDYGTNIPILGDHLSLFALLMAVTMWVYSKLTMATQAGGNDANAASMRFMSLWMMPIMMFFICNGLSAALSYYYLLSQMISIFETWIVRKTINQDAILAKVKASEGKPVPKSKWQQRLESAQKMQEQQLKQQQKQKRR